MDSTGDFNKWENWYLRLLVEKFCFYSSHGRSTIVGS